MNTKSRGHCWRLRLVGAVSNACRKTSFPPCHWVHHHRHARHDASSRHGKKKRPLAVQKVRLTPVKKKRSHSGHPRMDRSVLTSPIPASCKGKLFVQITLDTVRRSSSHLERAGEGLLFELPPFEESRERFLVGWEELLVCPASSSNSEPKVTSAAQCVAER